MIRINLLPVRELKKKEEIRNFLIIVGVMVVVVIGIMVYMKASINGRITRLTMEKNKTQQEIQRLNKLIGEVDKIKDIKKDLESKVKVIEQLNKGRNYTVHLLDELAKAVPVEPAKKIPRKIQLTSYEVKGSQVTIKGISLDESSVSAFTENLERSPYYQGVQIKKLSQAKGKIKSYQFELILLTEKPSENGGEK